MKCLLNSSDSSGDQHLPDAREGFLSFYFQPELLAPQKEESVVRNLCLLIDFVVCEQKLSTYKCEPRCTKKSRILISHFGLKHGHVD